MNNLEQVSLPIEAKGRDKDGVELVVDLEGPLEVNGDGLELQTKPIGQVEQA